jgi:GTP-binding protein
MKIKTAEFMTSAVKPSDYPKGRLPQIAFAGRSNVGKSSLINSLTNRKNLARTSRTPGRTQLINFFNINGNLHFVDLPGYGYAKVPHRVKKNWDKMIVQYLKDNPDLKLLVFILDARRIPSDLDKQLMSWLISYHIPFLFVVTKSDKISRSALNRQLTIIKKTLSPPEGIEFILYSAKTRLGQNELLSALDDVLKRETGGQK